VAILPCKGAGVNPFLSDPGMMDTSKGAGIRDLGTGSIPISGCGSGGSGRGAASRTRTRRPGGSPISPPCPTSPGGSCRRGRSGSRRRA